MPHQYILALGSNQGHRLGHLQDAATRLTPALQNMRHSAILETAAILPQNAPSSWDMPYLNMVITGKAELSPHELLTGIKQIEYDMGRRDTDKWAPRIIDIDILDWSGPALSTEQLTIPHHELPNRPFLRSLMASLDLGPFSWRQENPYPEPPRSYLLHPKLVGIVNITPDSFSDGGKHNDTGTAVQHMRQLVADGVSVLELGGQSTRPGSQQISWEMEWLRLEPVLRAVQNDELLAQVPLSVDTYYPDVVQKIKEMKLSNPLWINDVKGLREPRMLELLANMDCRVVLMHSLSVPSDPTNILPVEPDPIEQLLLWGRDMLQQIGNHGISKERVIFDPGIGFGKAPYQSMAILRQASRLKELGCPLFVGHSRKSFVRVFSVLPPPERDLETATMSVLLASQGVDYLRVHNVAVNMRALVASSFVAPNT
ncbi:MAG: dihydropteroate synthase [Proteobacteria bacterium]|nr:dihydropteroate synthase [Pseudomonadota bacterium]